MEKVSFLFVSENSVYKTLDVDAWDIKRDARNWPGGNACVAHPPCRAWGQLAHMAKPRPDEKELAVWVIEQVRKYGGVVEHPRLSKLWAHMGLPMPGKVDEYGGYTLSVNQSWWGHLAEKSTLLYIVGCSQMRLPSLPISFNAIEYTVGSRIKKKSGRRAKKELTKKQREETPIEFAKWLIEVAKRCNSRNGMSRKEMEETYTKSMQELREEICAMPEPKSKLPIQYELFLMKHSK